MHWITRRRLYGQARAHKDKEIDSFSTLTSKRTIHQHTASTSRPSPSCPIEAGLSVLPGRVCTSLLTSSPPPPTFPHSSLRAPSKPSIIMLVAPPSDLKRKRTALLIPLSHCLSVPPHPQRHIAPSVDRPSLPLPPLPLPF